MVRKRWKTVEPMASDDRCIIPMTVDNSRIIPMVVETSYPSSFVKFEIEKNLRKEFDEKDIIVTIPKSLLDGM